MFLYYILYALVVFASLSKTRLLKIIIIFTFILIVGLRFQVGADWYNYLTLYNALSLRSLKVNLTFTDPAYGLLNYLASSLKFDIWFVNLSCAIIFFLGLDYFCKNTKNYWIALLVAFPYLILSVSMGFTRQSVAIGLSMVAVTHLLKNNKYNFFVWIFLALLFHKSALLLLVFTPYAFNIKFTPLKSGLYFLMFTITLFIVMNRFSAQENLYFTDEVSSAGALVRMIIHTPAVGIYLLYRNRLKKIYREKLALLDALLALIVIFFFISFVYSTFADRFNLYFYIFDMLVLTSITLFFNRTNYFVYLSSVIFFEFILMMVWLNYSPWAQCCWIPYQNYLWAN